jgi:hypothetical protein
VSLFGGGETYVASILLHLNSSTDVNPCKSDFVLKVIKGIAVNMIERYYY